MRLEFCTIASGSSGNCTYIGSEHTKILIDAGISGKKIEEGLAELKLTGDQIDALFITHEHADHIKGAGILSRRFDIPIFATAETWAAMEGSLGKIAPSNKNIIYADEMCPINDICVKPFEIPHDTAEPVGYSIYAGEKKIASVAEKLELPIVHNPCPEDKDSKRAEFKKLIADMGEEYPDLKSKIFGAMQRLPLDGWEPTTRR